MTARSIRNTCHTWAPDDQSGLCLAGLAVVTPESAPVAYAPRWYKAWEQELHGKLVVRKEVDQWTLQRFSEDSGPETSRFSHRETLSAVSLAAKRALADAEKRCGRRVARERMALLYSDFWGRTSHLEHAFNWRDAFDLDVIPKSLLREHAIDGYSCKLQASRSSFPQGLQMAADLLCGGDIDIVLLGGVFRFYPALGFSEALENARFESRWLGRGGRHPAVIVERAGFMVLRRDDSRADLRTASLRLGSPQYLQLPKGRTASKHALAAAWQAASPDGIVFGGHYPSSLLRQLESEAVGERPYSNITEQFGDSGGLNPLLALQEMLVRGASSEMERGLLSLSGACGGTWVIRCDPLPAARAAV